MERAGVYKNLFIKSREGVAFLTKFSTAVNDIQVLADLFCTTGFFYTNFVRSKLLLHIKIMHFGKLWWTFVKEDNFW